MKVNACAEMYLWNRNFDRLVRVLQRLESFSISSTKELNAYEVRLEEIRAGLNADFAETMATRERVDQWRLNRQRTAWEKQDATGKNPNSSQKRPHALKRSVG